MADNTTEPTPATTSKEYDAQIKQWEKVEAILGGEGPIKAGKETYLPRLPEEEDSSYAYRLSSAPFTNIYADISANLASKPFSKELGLKDGSSDRFKRLGENIDGQGNNLHVYCQQTFKAGIDKGIDWIFVDFTKAKPRADGKPLTVAEEKEQGLRPYWVHISAERMIAVYSDFVGGQEVIHHARFMETAVQIDGFTEVCVQRIRVLTRDPIFEVVGNTITDAVIGYGPARWELWEQKTGADNKQTWVMVDGGDITIGVIPLVPFVPMSRKTGSWVVSAPLRDIANMQIKEYQQEANLEWVKIMTCFPMLSISGVSGKDEKGEPVKVKVGPSQVILIPPNQQGNGPAGEASYVEPTTASIKEVREQLELFRQEMRDLGMQPLAQANLTVVTTANVSKKASSAVQAWSFIFKDAIELAWKYTAQWLNDATEPEIEIYTDFSAETDGKDRLGAVLNAEKQGVISKRTAREELKRDGTLSANVTDEEEEQRLAEEGEGPNPEEAIDPRTGQPIREPEDT